MCRKDRDDDVDDNVHDEVVAHSFRSDKISPDRVNDGDDDDSVEDDAVLRITTTTTEWRTTRCCKGITSGGDGGMMG